MMSDCRDIDYIEPFRCLAFRFQNSSKGVLANRKKAKRDVFRYDIVTVNNDRSRPSKPRGTVPARHTQIGITIGNPKPIYHVVTNCHP
uniref:Uncharacterized protein n=1 Tax=Pararge aegeria TaxID=116150 RepID=S4PSY4_9NEOP